MWQAFLIGQVAFKPRSKPMLSPRRGYAALMLTLFCLGGCSSSESREQPRHRGAKINILDFIHNTAAYKGRLLYLNLKIDEAMPAGQSLRDYVGRDVRFISAAPNGEPLKLVITLPESLSVPEAAGHGDEVGVTFFCKAGNLQGGNEAKSIELGAGVPDVD
jgi:hypothetical protein